MDLRSSALGAIADPFRNEYLASMPRWWKGVRLLMGVTIFPVRVVVLLALVPVTVMCLVPFWPWGCSTEASNPQNV